MNDAGKITNASALRLQHASAQIQARTQLAGSTAANAGNVGNAGVPFADLLNQKVNSSGQLHFSKHATQRVQERGIEVTENLLSDLNQAVQKAKAKGAKDVVVIGENGAFIVNVPNNVVVTTMSGAEMRENIFTNIDSAVLM